MSKRRGQQGGARLDDTVLRRMVLKHTPMATSLGVVRKFPGEDSHFEIIVDPSTGNREVMVDVELIPRSERVLCRLGFGGDQIYKIPRVDSEVAVLIPQARNALVQDELEMDPIIVAVLDTNAPSALDSDQVVVISARTVKVLADISIQLGSVTSALAKQSDLEALAAHVDTLLVGGTGSAASPPGTAPAGSGTVKVTAE